MIATEDVQMGCMLAYEGEDGVRRYAFALDTAADFVGFAKHDIKAGDMVTPSDYLSGGLALGERIKTYRNDAG